LERCSRQSLCCTYKPEGPNGNAVRTLSHAPLFGFDYLLLRGSYVSQEGLTVEARIEGTAEGALSAQTFALVPHHATEATSDAEVKEIPYVLNDVHGSVAVAPD
jgi:hypothetical protein